VNSRTLFLGLWSEAEPYPQQAVAGQSLDTDSFSKIWGLQVVGEKIEDSIGSKGGALEQMSKGSLPVPT
jgi:hypothetical protein